MRRLLFLLLLVGGCSATTEIANRANSVQETAHATIELVAPSVEAGQPIAPEVGQEVIDNQRLIIAHAGSIGTAVVRTQDTPGFFDRLGGLLKWLAIAAALVAVCYFGWTTGLFAPIGGLVQFITPRKRATAAMIVDTLDPKRPESTRELVAAMRGADPALSKAIDQEKAARQEEEAQQ